MITSWRKLPPGPPGLPVLGNILELPALRPHPKVVIFLNSAEAADELLANLKRSSNYSNRAVPHVAHDIILDGLGITFMEYGPSWKVLRKALQTALGHGPSKQLRQVQEYEARVLMYALMQHGEQSIAQKTESTARDPCKVVMQGHWHALVRRHATSVTLYALYGKRVNRVVDNPDLHMIYDVIDNMVRVSLPGNYLADSFPFL
ncbi:cytochrome P450 [Fomitopsis betulina]|nr:cytochrome P450 [Fomitopsis betulina]